MKKIMRRILSVFTATTLCFSLMATVPVTAETVGAFDIEGGVINTDYTYENGVLTINTDTPIRIKNTDPDVSTTDRIVVADGVSAKITLAGVNIDVSDTGETIPFTNGVSALEIFDNSTGNIEITLADNTVNILKSGYGRAGLRKNGTNGSLEIKGTGSLEAVGGGSGAGIGGDNITEEIGSYIGGSGSNITINSGTIIAKGGKGGAGIGGGSLGVGSDITINGGEITATGGGIDGNSYNRCGAGIGGGHQSDGIRITITDGVIKAIAGEDGAAGIGGGASGVGSDITIEGGNVTAEGSKIGAGIGGGFDGIGSNITISGGIVTVIAKYGAGIGGGSCATSSDITITGSSSVKSFSTYSNSIGGGQNEEPLTPKNDNSENVYLLELDVDGTSDVTINQIAYPKNHGTDNKLYVYLPAKTEADPNVVKIGNDTLKYYYDLVNSEWVKIEETITEVATPVFNPENETEFIDSQTVTITCDTEGATIYYTTDGTTPSTSGNVYNGELIITETTTIKAIAVKDGIESEIATAEYIKKTSDDDEPDLPSPPSPPSSSDDDDDDDDDDNDDNGDDDNDDNDDDDNDDDGDISAGENIFIKEIIL